MSITSRFFHNSSPVLSFFFFWSYCILFVAQLWQHKALIYSKAVGGACRARARRAITLTSNCRETQPRDRDHKSVSDEPRHSQLICIHPTAGLLSESISTGAETAAAAAVGGCERRWLGGDVQCVESGLMLSGFVSLHLTANRCVEGGMWAASHMVDTTTDSED